MLPGQTFLYSLFYRILKGTALKHATNLTIDESVDQSHLNTLVSALHPLTRPASPNSCTTASFSKTRLVPIYSSSEFSWTGDEMDYEAVLSKLGVLPSRALPAGLSNLSAASAFEIGVFIPVVGPYLLRCYMRISDEWNDTRRSGISAGTAEYWLWAAKYSNTIFLFATSPSTVCRFLKNSLKRLK